MTNEELALKIQNGERNLIPTLWEQVERNKVVKRVSHMPRKAAIV